MEALTVFLAYPHKNNKQFVLEKTGGNEIKQKGNEILIREKSNSYWVTDHKISVFYEKKHIDSIVSLLTALITETNGVGIKMYTTNVLEEMTARLPLGKYNIL